MPTPITLSGYSPTYEFWGTRYSQMSLEAVSLHLTIDQITSGFLQKPDPNVVLEHNRKISEAHAKKFAQYLLRGAVDTTGKWPVIVPALSLFTNPVGADFDSVEDFQAGDFIQFGIFKVQKTSPVNIWDGQHRTLGAYLAIDEKNRQIADLAHALAKAESEGKGEQAAEIEEKLKTAKDERERLGSIVVPVSIALETDKDKIAALFSDVADNAKGINASALTRLDQRNVFHRVASAIFEGDEDWNLLVGLIDDTNDYTTANNPHWTTYRDIAQVAQIAWMGYGSRWTPQQENAKLAAQENEILDVTREFYEVLQESFDDVADILSEDVEPGELRGSGSRPSLLSSSVMLKALASAFHDLKFGKAWVKVPTKTNLQRLTAGLPEFTRDQIVSGFQSLPSMRVKHGDKNALDALWLDTGVFEHPYTAPTARGSNSRVLGKAVTDFIRPIDFSKSGK
jgi:hypothetical protein